MSIPIHVLVGAVATTISAELEKEVLELAKQQLSSQPGLAEQFVPAITAWFKQAKEKIAPGVHLLPVPVASSGAPSGAPIAQAGAFPPFGGNPMAQQAPAGFGAAPPQFGQQAFGMPAPSAGLPKNASLTIEGCGRCRVPGNMSNQGATCGVQFTKKDSGSQKFYCTAAATVIGQSGLWACSGHKGRPTPDHTGRGGGKKSGGAGGPSPMVSAQQIMGLRGPNGLPAGFGAPAGGPGFAPNPAMAGGLAGMMGAQPQQQPFGAPGGFPGIQPVVPSNQALSNQLMGNVASQVGGIPQQQQFPGLGGVNVNQMLTGAPSAGAFGGQQVAQFQPLQPAQSAAGFDEDGSGDDSDSDDEVDHTPLPVPTTDQNALRNAMASAGIPQAAPAGFPGMGGFNPLGQQPAQVQPQQQQAPAGFPGFNPLGPQPVQVQPQIQQQQQAPAGFPGMGGFNPLGQPPAQPVQVQPQQQPAQNPLAAQAAPNPLMAAFNQATQQQQPAQSQPVQVQQQAPQQTAGAPVDMSALLAQATQQQPAQQPAAAN